MFPNTITLTINAVARVLIRNNQDNYGSEYQYFGALESVVMLIRHSVDQVDKRSGQVTKRHNVFVEHFVYPTVAFPQGIINTSTLTMRHGQFTDPVLSADLLKAVNSWAGTSTNIVDLAAGTN
nr:MAG: hypothetical protein 2 [Leviviridae sp.]